MIEEITLTCSPPFPSNSNEKFEDDFFYDDLPKELLNVIHKDFEKLHYYSELAINSKFNPSNYIPYRRSSEKHMERIKSETCILHSLCEEVWKSSL